MRAGDTLRRDTVRFILAAVRNEEVARVGAAVDRLTVEGKDEVARAAWLAEHRPGEIDDAGVQEVLRRQAKMRRDAIDAFRKGGRDELAAKEEKELAIIGSYLPAQIDETKIRQIAERVISETGAKGPQDTKLVMPKVIAETKGRADGRLVASVVGELLKARAS